MSTVHNYSCLVGTCLVKVMLDITTVERQVVANKRVHGYKVTIAYVKYSRGSGSGMHA